MAEDDGQTWEDLFGEGGNETRGKEPEDTKAKKDKKDKKDKKEKKEGKEPKEKKDKKDKDKKDKKEHSSLKAEIVGGAQAEAEAQVPEAQVPEAQVPNKEKKDKKEKKEKKDKKDKKKQKEYESWTTEKLEETLANLGLDSDGDRATLIARLVSLDAPAAAVAPAEASSSGHILKIRKPKGKDASKVVLPVAQSQPEAEAAAPADKDKKHKKDKKEKKEGKKDKKRKGMDDDIVAPEPDEVAPLPTVEPPPTDVIDDTLMESAFEDINVPKTIPTYESLEDDRLFDMPEDEPEDTENILGGAVNDPQDDEAEDALHDFMGDLEAPVDDEDVVPSHQTTAEHVPVITPPFIDKRSGGKKRRTQRLVPATQDEDPEFDSNEKLRAVMESLKPKRALQIAETDAMPFIQAFVQEMEEASEKDLRQFEAGRLHEMKFKMNMLGKAVSVMQKFVFGDLFVTYGGCRALALWLRKLPNGQLPNAHLRTKILNAMLRLPISKEALQNCKDPPLGEIVANLMRNPNETVGNRTCAAQLVQKWVKQVLVTNIEPTSESLDAEEGPQPMLQRKAEETFESFLEAEEESFKRMHPSIPIREGKEYSVHPAITAEPMKKFKYSDDSNRHKLNEVLKIFDRPNKKAWKPFEVSIAGRQLNQL